MAGSGSDRRSEVSATATRIDESAGIREEIEFFGPELAKVYACLHAPLGRPVGGVVVCCSVHAELQENYRSEVLLARALAARGLAVQRFHYRGFGHSDGAPVEATFESMREDALAAVDRLRVKTGVSRPALLGARLGGLVAASAARELDGAPLVLWEPTRDPVGYFREAIRARLIHELRTGAGTRPSGDALIGELRDKGVLDVLGYPIHRRLYDSAGRRTLSAELGNRPRPILLVQLSRSRRLGPGYARLVGQLREDGFGVVAEVVPEQPAWWFSRGAARSMEVLGEATASWLVRELEAMRS